MRRRRPVGGVEDQDEIRLADLEDDPPRADQEVRVDFPGRRGVRPVEQAGIAVEGQQGLVASEAEDPVADDPEVLERPGAGLALGLERGLAGERVGPGLGLAVPAQVVLPLDGPLVEAQGNQTALGRRDDLVGEVADPDRSPSRSADQAEFARGRVDRPDLAPLDQEDPAGLGRGRHAGGPERPGGRGEATVPSSTERDGHARLGPVARPSRSERVARPGGPATQLGGPWPARRRSARRRISSAAWRCRRRRPRPRASGPRRPWPGPRGARARVASSGAAASSRL